MTWGVRPGTVRRGVRRRVDGTDVVVAIGLAMLGAGLGAFDWRVALVGLGLILILVGMAGALRRG